MTPEVSKSRVLFDCPPLLIVYYDVTDRVVIIGAGGLRALSLTRLEVLQAMQRTQAQRRTPDDPRPTT